MGGVGLAVRERTYLYEWLVEALAVHFDPIVALHQSFIVTLFVVEHHVIWGGDVDLGSCRGVVEVRC